MIRWDQVLGGEVSAGNRQYRPPPRKKKQKRNRNVVAVVDPATNRSPYLVKQWEAMPKLSRRQNNYNLYKRKNKNKKRNKNKKSGKGGGEELEETHGTLTKEQREAARKIREKCADKVILLHIE